MTYDRAEEKDSIETWVDELDMPEGVAEDAMEIFDLPEDVNPGLSRTRRAAASMLAACYKNGLGVPTTAIEQTAGVENLGTAYLRLADRLGLELLSPPVSAYVRYVNRTLDIELADETAELAEKIAETVYSGSGSKRVTAAEAIFISTLRDGERNIVQAKVCEASYVSKQAIRLARQDNKDLLLDTDVSTENATYEFKEVDEYNINFPFPFRVDS